MKKILVVMVMLVFCLAVIAGGKCAGKSGGFKNAAKAEAYKKYAASYEKQAKHAEEKGKTNLATVYRKCAAAKLKISKAYATGNKELLKIAHKEYGEARKERNVLQGKTCKKKRACTKKHVYPKKKECNKKKETNTKTEDGWDGGLN